MRALRVRANRIGATLQAKRSWLPKITSPRSSLETPIKENGSIASAKIKPEAVKGEDKVGLQNADKGINENEDAAEKAAQEKVEKETQRRLEKSIKKAKRDLWWRKLKTDINYRLELIRIYRVPILILLVTLAIVIPLSLDLANKMSESPQTLTKTPISTVALTAQLIVPSHTSKPILKPTETFLPSKTPVASVTPTATPLPVEIIDAKGVTMRLVPAGEFTMGSDNGMDDEKPAHTVYLDAFYIDKYEFTVALYQVCINEGVCSGRFEKDYYDKYKNHPVTDVDWSMAGTYCAWRNARLPTEAEWEKSARGTDARTYPWGETLSCDKANYEGCVGHTTVVGSYESGKSIYGVYDLVGNVWEWVADFYQPNYYYTLGQQAVNPQGPISGSKHILRGGSFSNISMLSTPDQSRSSLRFPLIGFISDVTGFRCATDAVP